MRVSEKTLKRLIWLFALPVAAVLGVGALREMAALFNYFQRAQVVDSALHLVEPRRAESNRLIWLEDAANTVRKMEVFSRDAISNDYMIAFEELTYSVYTGDTSGLKSYFQSAALDDARLASKTPAEFIDWNHQLQLYFYALDGGTVGLTDTFDYAQGVVYGEDIQDMRLARRTMEAIIKLDDGNWRIHHWRTLKDTPITFPRQSFPELAEVLKDVRGVHYVARSVPPQEFWLQPDTTELIADFSNIARLGLNTLEISLPYPASEEIAENVLAFIDLASTYNFKVIISLLERHTDYQLEAIPQLQAYLDSLALALGHPDVLAIKFGLQDELLDMYRSTSILSYLMAYARDVSAKPVLTSSPDLVTQADALVQSGDVEVAAGGLPTLMTFGFEENLLSLKPQGQKQQAWLYQEAVDDATQQKRGWIIRALYDLPGTHQSAIHMGLLNLDGTPKLAAGVVLGEEVSAPDILDRIMDYRYLLAASVTVLCVCIVVWVRFVRTAADKK